MKIRTLLTGIAAALMIGSGAWAQEVVRFWYHFDSPENPIDELVAEFEAENPGIEIQAENIVWGGGGEYYDSLTTSILGGNPPDAAMVKLFAQPQLIEMGALEPLDPWLENWDGKKDISDDLWRVNGSPDGSAQYYMPLQFVVLYLYYRADLFEEAGLAPPTNREEFLAAAKALTKDNDGDGQTDIYGFGMRGGKGGHDHWATFVLSSGASFESGGLSTPEAIAANQWFIDLHREHAVFPPSAPVDGFQQITGGFQAGRTAMTIHHIGSSKAMVEALGDKVSAVPVPQGSQGAWTAFGDESTAIFSASEVKDAAFKWISFLSSAENNIKFNEASGQLPVTAAALDNWTLHERRFVDATINSLPFAQTLPSVPQTSEFVGNVWPVNMQRALLGEITAEEMLQEIEELYAQ